MHDIECVDPFAISRAGKQVFGLVAERRRALRQIVVAPGELLRRLACDVFAVYS